MQYITGTNRHQTVFTTLEEQVSAENAVRLIDAFVEKLDVIKLGFTTASLKTKGRPPYAPQVLLKLYLYGYLKRMWPQYRASVVAATSCAELSYHCRL
jgi:transposase